MTEEAAQIVDENMPPLEEVEINPEAVKEETPKAESAPVEEVDLQEKPEIDGVQKRINKITADKHAEKRRADELQKQLDALQAQPKPEQKKPELEDFDYDDAKFNEALIDHKVNLKSQELQQQQKATLEQQVLNETLANFNKRETEFADKVPDYMESVQNLPQFPQDVVDILMRADDGLQIAYYLSKHLDVADEIANPVSGMATLKLGQISAQLSGSKPDKQTSAAPEPIEPITSSGSLDKKEEDMSMEEIYNMG